MQIGNVKTKNNIFLAPMAGITDNAFRILCAEQDCGLTFSEMVSIKGITYGNEKTLTLLQTCSAPFAIQLFGHEPKVFADAIKSISNLQHDIIDINMGCPAKKIIRNGDGSALMQNPMLISKIIEACVKATDKPITVKIRMGFDTVNAVEVAKVIEQSGASAITIHGRTCKQGYSGKADWNIFYDVKQVVDIPVIGNGDVKTPQDAEQVLKVCDGVMIGRASLGNPWLFKQIDMFMSTGEMFYPTAHDKITMALKHLSLMHDNVIEMRKHLAWYTKNFHNASDIRTQINKSNTRYEFEILLMSLLTAL